MTNHFLSVVCFGCLITYLIFSAVSMVFLQIVRKHSSKNDKAD
jgi:ribosomal protein S27E